MPEPTKPTPSPVEKTPRERVVTPDPEIRVDTYLDAQEASLAGDRRAEQRKADDHTRESAVHLEQAEIHVANVQRLTGAIAQIHEMRGSFGFEKGQGGGSAAPESAPIPEAATV